MSLTIVFSQLFLMKCDVLPFSLFQIDIFASKYLIPQYSGSIDIYPHTCIIMILHKIISNYFTQIWLKTTGTCFIQKYMPPPLPYFKVNICPLPLPHFASIFFAYLWSFRWPNYIVTLPRYFSFRLPHLNINTVPPHTNWTRIFSESRIFYFSVTETDTTTSGLRWIFHMHSEFSRPAMVTMPSWSSPLKCKVSL